MDAENFALYNGSNSKVIENLGAVFPWVGISVLSDCFIIETIDSGDLSSLVISSKKSDVGWIFEFQTKEKLESLNRVETSVDEISHENISRVWDLSSLVE